MKQPKVSVVVPVYNVEQYLSECLDSALAQTLEDIEIICVDDGSTDSCPQILDEYAAKDSRVKVIHKPNSGYGHSMNVGLDHATGEYYAILESDDIIKPNMYEVLYDAAKKNDLDIVKSDFEIFVGDVDHREFTYNQICNRDSYYYRVLNPIQRKDIFNVKMHTWTGLYKISFLKKYNIRYNETPGASYQDNGFWFLTFAYATRVYFIDRAFYMLRRDNPNSSVHNRKKVFCIFDEYDFIEKRLRSDNVREAALISMFHKKKFDNCRFHYERIGDEFKMDFLRRMSDDFKCARANDELDSSLFVGKGYNELCSIMDETEKFYLRRLEGKSEIQSPEQRVKVLEQELYDVYHSRSYKIGRAITFVPRIIRGGIWCVRDHGIMYTIRLAFAKLGRKKSV